MDLVDTNELCLITRRLRSLLNVLPGPSKADRPWGRCFHSVPQGPGTGETTPSSAAGPSPHYPTPAWSEMGGKGGQLPSKWRAPGERSSAVVKKALS